MRDRRSRNRRFYAGVAFTLFAFSHPALAQVSEDYFELPPEQLLNAEVVSVSKRAEKVSEAPAAVFVITAEDIERAGVQSIPEALRLAPGVQVARADSNSWAISIRGFNGVLANKLLVMIDGRTIYNPLFAGTYWELQDLLLEDIDRIEVVRGPGGALWGANAVNGVINIITKSAKNTQGNLVSAGYGNEEGVAGARQGGSFGEDRFYRVYAKYFDRDSFRKPSGADGDDDWHGYRSGFRMDWSEDATLQGDIYRTLTDQLNSTPGATPGATMVEKETMDSVGANILGRWKKKMDDNSLFTVQSYLDFTQRDQILLKDERYMFDLETQYDLASRGPHEITLGGGYRFMTDDLQGNSIVSFAPDNRNDNLFSFFAQDKIALVPEKWYLTLGSKFEHNDYTGFEVQPNARLQWHPDLSQTVWTSVSRAVRTPSRLEHDMTYRIGVIAPSTQVIYNANPDFKSEELIAYELGYRKQVNEDFSFDLATFYNVYDDLGTFGFLPTSPGVLPVNTSNNMEAETQGFEIAATWNVSPTFLLQGSYSYLDIFAHVAQNGGFNLETAELQSPHHQANLRASWKITDDVSLDGTAYYVDELQSGNVGDYVRADLNLGWRLDDGVKFNLIGQNLLDGAHREFNGPTSLNAGEVERSVFGKITWQF